MSTTPRQDMLITDLFDTITNYNCLTHQDIADNSRLLTVADVCQVLSWIRNPEVSKEFGWSVPHVNRGRPAQGEQYRYIVVGLNGHMLSPDDIQLVRRGALSTMRITASSTRNEAHAIRLTIPMYTDPQYQRRARQMSRALDGVSAQAEMEAERLAALP